MNTPPIVLASASPRRADILTMLGLTFTVAPAWVPEERSPGESPVDYVERLAREKGQAVWERNPEALVVAGDTVVALDGDVLEKPKTAEEAVSMLLALQGRTHVVHTGLALVSPEGKVETKVSSPSVSFREFSRFETEHYVASGEPMDKAGAYGIQGFGSTLVREIHGDYFAVVGLSPFAFQELLKRHGMAYSFGTIVALAGVAAD